MERRILAFGPVLGGVGDSFRATMTALAGQPDLVLAVHDVAPCARPMRDTGDIVRGHVGALATADLVHVEFGSNDLTLFWLALRIARGGVPLLAVVHDFPLLVHRPAVGLLGCESRWRSRVGHRVLSPLLDDCLRRHLLRGAAGVAVFGEEARRAWQPLATGPVSVIPHGALSQSLGETLPSRGRYVLFAGYIGPAKGVDLLLEAWRTIGPSTSFELVLAGRVEEPVDSEFAGLREESRRWPNPPRWLGYVDGEDALQRLIDDAAVVALPYRRSSPASGVLVRAMTAGRAILASDAPAFTSHLQGGENGLVFPRGDARALRNSLIALMADGRLRDALGTAAANHAAGAFSVEAHVKALRELYDAISPRPWMHQNQEAGCT